MKIVVKVSRDENESERHVVFVDDKRLKSIYPLCECPEDATIERDLMSGYDLAQFAQLGFDAAKRGEELEIVYWDKAEAS